jgi:sulfate transport system substrate-binding protein
MAWFSRKERSTSESSSWVRSLGWFVLACAIGAAIWYGQRRPAIEIPRTVTVYAFSAMDDVLADAILPAFQKHWRDRTGERVEFITTFAGSGAITREILGKIPVEVALLSSEIDAARLANRGMTSGRVWERLPRRGIVTRSPMVILVRAGNPKEIHSFADLLREGMRVVHCDPLTSGAGEWSILSMHAALQRLPGGAAQAAAGRDRLRDRIVSSEPSARAALVAFTRGGKGDALITYEREWLSLDADRRRDLQIVYPRTTLMSEHLVVRLDKNIDPNKRAVVDGLVEFLWSEEAQALFAADGFMGPDPAATARGEFGTVLTLDDLGGPAEAERKILAPWLRRPPAPAVPTD